jgi:ankyrin repeat protein
MKVMKGMKGMKGNFMKSRRLPLFLLAIGLTSSVVIAQVQAPPVVADAANRGNVEGVRALLKQGADVNAAQPDGMTALHWAAERGDVAMAEMLLYAGANTAAVTRIGQYTALHLASRSGSAPVVKALIKAGANVSAKSGTGSVTPLHLAAGSGSVDAVVALLDKGADVNAKETEWDQTPLIFAAAADRYDVVLTLLKRGADVKAASKALNLTTQSAADRQAVAVQRQVLAAAVPRGEDPTASQQQAAIQAAREFYLTGKAPEPPAAAGAAAGGGRGGGRGGAAPPAAGGAAPAPDAAAPQAGRGGQGGGTGGAQQPIDRLNEDGPPPALSAKGGMTALHHAARQGNVKTASALLEGGSEINRKSADGNSPLLVAIINGQFDVAMLLIQQGAEVNQPAEGLGVTPLWAAINTRWQPRTRFPQPQEMELQKATYLDVMEALLKKGADPDARTRVHPWYMVYTGCGNGNCGLPSTVGSTAFWRSAFSVDVDAMRLLVKYGADPYIPTMTGAGGGGGGRGGGAAGGRGGAPAGRGAGPAGAAPGGAPAPDNAAPAAPPEPRVDPSGMPPVPAAGPGIYAIHAAAGVEYGEGFIGNAHRHAPNGWMPSIKYLVEELGFDVNMRDDGGYTPLHHAAARGDNEMIKYLVSKGADVKAVSRRNQTTADMANGPVSRISPFPETIKLLVSLGAVNNNKCASCAP